LKTGTALIAPNAKTKRVGMSGSAFNKCVDGLRAVLELARENGGAIRIPPGDHQGAEEKKRLELPSPEQFRELVTRIKARHDAP